MVSWTSQWNRWAERNPAIAFLVGTAGDWVGVVGCRPLSEEGVVSFWSNLQCSMAAVCAFAMCCSAAGAIWGRLGEGGGSSLGVLWYGVPPSLHYRRSVPTSVATVGVSPYLRA